MNIFVANEWNLILAVFPERFKVFNNYTFPWLNQGSAIFSSLLQSVFAYVRYDITDNYDCLLPVTEFLIY